jgi:Peptidyl-tRNA hydrolase PTH2
MIEEKRIYVVIAGTIQVPASRRSVIQPLGRQIAQACHAVSMLRHWDTKAATCVAECSGAATQVLVPEFNPMTTVILQARDSAELGHVNYLLLKKKLQPAVFLDTNDGAYGPTTGVPTALAVFATKRQIENVLDYLPLWGAS